MDITETTTTNPPAVAAELRPILSRKDMDRQKAVCLSNLIDNFVSTLENELSYSHHRPTSANKQALVYCGGTQIARSADPILSVAWSHYWQRERLFDKYDPSYRDYVFNHIPEVLNRLKDSFEEVWQPIRGEFKKGFDWLLPKEGMWGCYAVNTWQPFVIHKPEADPHEPPPEFEPFGKWADVEDWVEDVKHWRNAHIWLTEYFERLFPIKEERDIVVQWIAAIIQRPDEKPTWSILCSSTTGTGKGFMFHQILYPLTAGLEVQAKKFSEITTKHSTINAEKLVVQIDDATATAGQAQQLKSLQTERRILVERKYQDQSYVPSLARYLLFTNELVGAMDIEANDRRWFVTSYIEHRVSEEESAHFLHGFESWIMQDEALHKAAMWCLFNNVKLDKYNPKICPKPTDAKLRMIGETEDYLLEESFNLFLADRDEGLNREGFFTTKELTQFTRGIKYSPDELNKAVTKAGYVKRKVSAEVGKGSRPSYYYQPDKFDKKVDADKAFMSRFINPDSEILIK